MLHPENTRLVFEPNAGEGYPLGKTGVAVTGKPISFKLNVYEPLSGGQGVIQPTIVDRLEIIPFASTQVLLQAGIYVEIGGKFILVTSSSAFNQVRLYAGQPAQLIFTKPFELYPSLAFYITFVTNGGSAELSQYKYGGEGVEQKRYRLSTPEPKSLGAELNETFTTVEKEGQPAIAFRGPVPTIPRRPQLAETQRAMRTIASQWPMSSAASVGGQIGGLRVIERALQIGSPLYRLAGLNVDDVAWSAAGRTVSSVRAYFQSSPERGFVPAGASPSYYAYSSTNGLTVEGITRPYSSGAAFWLYNNNQMRVVVKGTTIEFLLFFTGGTKTLVATSAMQFGFPQLVQCIYNPTTKKMSVWVNGVEKASQTATGTLPTESRVNTTGTLNSTTTITALPINTLGMGIGWPIEGPAIPSNTTITEILSASSVKISAAATKTESGAALKVYVPESLLVPEGTAAIEAIGEDIAVYESVLSKARIEEHMYAFRQNRADPAHVYV